MIQQERKEKRDSERKQRIVVTNKNVYIYIHIVSEVGDHSRGWPEGSIFDRMGWVGTLITIISL